MASNRIPAIALRDHHARMVALHEQCGRCAKTPRQIAIDQAAKQRSQEHVNRYEERMKR